MDICLLAHGPTSTNSLLILLRFPAIDALAFALIFNAVAFGGLGVPVSVPSE